MAEGIEVPEEIERTGNVAVTECEPSDLFGLCPPFVPTEVSNLSARGTDLFHTVGFSVVSRQYFKGGFMVGTKTETTKWTRRGARNV